MSVNELENFVTACQESALNAGAPAEQVEPYCNCAVQEVQNRFTFTEFQEIETLIQKGSSPPPEFTSIVPFCLNPSP